MTAEGTGPIELLFVSEFVKCLAEAFRAAIDDGESAGDEDFAINRLEQTFGGRLGVDSDDAAGPDVGGVADEDFGPAIEVEVIQHENGLNRKRWLVTLWDREVFWWLAFWDVK